MTVKEQRKRVIEEARSWIGTPYHHHGRVKGAGVDCAQILIDVYHAAGMIPDIDVGAYSQQWHLHRSEEKYLGWVRQFGHQVESPEPGDLVVYKIGRTFSHGGIVIDWPLIIHSWHSCGVVYMEGDNGELRERQRVFFSLWGTA